MKTKKVSLESMKSLSREEMKKIMAGSGQCVSVCTSDDDCTKGSSSCTTCGPVLGTSRFCE